MDPVVLTSRWMAAARARESERPDRLFNDPLAAALAGPEGFAWLDRMEPAARLGGPGLYAVVRTRFFDDFLLHASQRTGARQLIILAAGMDARAFRMEWLPGTRLYELDRPEVLATKDALIARAGAHPTCERRAIEADLERPSWSAALLDAGYEVREPSVWLAEGVFFYMTEAAVRAPWGRERADVPSQSARCGPRQPGPPDVPSDGAITVDLLPPRRHGTLWHQ